MPETSNVKYVSELFFMPEKGLESLVVAFIEYFTFFQGQYFLFSNLIFGESLQKLDNY